MLKKSQYNEDNVHQEVEFERSPYFRQYNDKSVTEKGKTWDRESSFDNDHDYDERR